MSSFSSTQSVPKKSFCDPYLKMARLAVICFLFVLCAVATSAAIYPQISRSDQSTVVLRRQDDVTVHIQGETKKVDEFLKAVEVGRASIEGPYLDLEIYTLHQQRARCGTVDRRDSEETTEPTKIEDPIQHVEVQTRPTVLETFKPANGQIIDTKWMEDAHRLFWGANSI